jgi:GntR family transcriptional regulator, transcriptional repressor for pyruvate dehydrogenase complex
MPLQPVARRSVSDAVFDQLQDEIVQGHLAPGEALPAERSLTELLGVNRQAVREALKRLHQAGLVEITHGGATRVRDYRNSAGLDLLASLLVASDGSVDGAVARSIMEMRACIGPDAARLCAGRVLPEVARQITDVVDAMAEAREGRASGDDLDRLGDLDWTFWELVVDGADNIAYRLAFNSLRDSAKSQRNLREVVVADEWRDLDRHRRLAAAITEGASASAEAIARELLSQGTTAVTALLAESPASSEPTEPTDSIDAEEASR